VIAELRFEYVVNKVRQLAIFDAEVDACRNKDDSHAHERAPKPAVALIDIVGEASDDHANSPDSEENVSANGSHE
jgi:hypothetical protein